MHLIPYTLTAYTSEHTPQSIHLTPCTMHLTPHSMHLTLTPIEGVPMWSGFVCLTRQAGVLLNKMHQSDWELRTENSPLSRTNLIYINTWSGSSSWLFGAILSQEISLYLLGEDFDEDQIGQKQFSKTRFTFIFRKRENKEDWLMAGLSG